MRRLLAPLSAVLCVPIAAVVASALGADVVFAAVGAGLGFLYAALDLGTTLLAARSSFNRSLVVGVGGMALRLIVVLVALAVIGLLTDREQMLAAVMGFVGTFTVSLAVRLAVTPSLLASGSDGAGRAAQAAAPLIPPERTRR